MFVKHHYIYPEEKEPVSEGESGASSEDHSERHQLQHQHYAHHPGLRGGETPRKYVELTDDIYLQSSRPMWTTWRQCTEWSRPQTTAGSSSTQPTPTLRDLFSSPPCPPSDHPLVWALHRRIPPGRINIFAYLVIHIDKNSKIK